MTATREPIRLNLYISTGTLMMDGEQTANGDEATLSAANLENEALKRKKRIEAMRQLKEQQEQGRQLSTEAQQQPLPRYSSINK